MGIQCFLHGQRKAILGGEVAVYNACSLKHLKSLLIFVLANFEQQFIPAVP